MPITPNALEAAVETNRAIRRSKMEEFAHLHSDYSLSFPEICKRIGVTERTGGRYRSELIKAGIIYPRSVAIVMNTDKQLERVRNMPRHPDGRFM